MVSFSSVVWIVLIGWFGKAFFDLWGTTPTPLLPFPPKRSYHGTLVHPGEKGGVNARATTQSPSPVRPANR